MIWRHYWPKKVKKSGALQGGDGSKITVKLELRPPENISYGTAKFCTTIHTWPFQPMPTPIWV